MIAVRHGAKWTNGFTSWVSIVRLVGDEGIWVDWEYVSGIPGDLLFVPHGEWEIEDL